MLLNLKAFIRRISAFRANDDDKPLGEQTKHSSSREKVLRIGSYNASGKVVHKLDAAGLPSTINLYMLSIEKAAT